MEVLLDTCSQHKLMFPQHSFHGGTPKIIFHIQGALNYENIYRSEKADSEELSVTNGEAAP